MDRNELLDLLSDMVRAEPDETEQQREHLADFLIGMSRRQVVLEQKVKELEEKQRRGPDPRHFSGDW